MIKNIILDIGGIILDDSSNNLSKVYGKDMKEISMKIYRGGFEKCLLGKLSMTEFSDSFTDDDDYQYIKEILNPTNQSIMNPLMKDNFEYICTLKDKGYHLYLLSNLTKETYDYLSSTIDIDSYFDGAIFSYKVGLMKPNKEIFKLIIEKYNLNLDETIFFDDRERNVIASNEVGLKAILFRSIEDIRKELNDEIK